MGPVIGFLGAVLFGAAAGSSLIYVLAVNLARVALLSLAARLTAPKVDLTTEAANKLLTVRGTVQPQGFTYGRDMISGPLIWAQVAGDGNNDLHRIVALHGREIDSIVSYRIDDTDISIGSPGDMASAAAAVTGGQFAGVLTIDRRLGTTAQTAITAMTSAFSTLWTSAHRARGWSLIYAKMTLEAGNTAYENGIPQNIRALTDGHLVYDPRLDSTQVIDPTTSPDTFGSGAHRLTDDTTWEWSENPALLLGDFMRWDIVGVGEEDDRIDYVLCAAAADICDQQVVIPPTASPSITQKRYTCNLTFFSNRDRGDIKRMLETAMLGRTVFSQGQWKMWAGAAITPDVVLTEANLSGPIQMQASTGSQERYNRVRGKFIDPTRNYSAAVYPEQRSASFEASDTEVRYNIFDINTANNSFEAQRDAIIRLRQSRLQRTMVFPGNWSCFRIQPGAVVQLSVGELSLDTSPLTKWFVTEWALQKDGSGVGLTLVEEDDTVWADPAVGDYTVRTPTGELIPVDQGPVKLTGGNLHNSRVVSCEAGLELGSDGDAKYAGADGVFSIAGVPLGEWRLRGGADYWVRATLNSGTLDTGTTGSWLALSTTREWTVARATVGTDTANITVEIATDDAGADIIETATFDLEAIVSVQPMVLASKGAWFYSSSGSSFDIPLAAGIAAGDLLLVFGAGRALAVTSQDDPARWQRLHQSAVSSSRMVLWGRIADGTADDNFQSNGTGTRAVQMARFTGNAFSGSPFSGIKISDDEIDAVTQTTFNYPIVPNSAEVATLNIVMSAKFTTDTSDGNSYSEQTGINLIDQIQGDLGSADLAGIWGYVFQASGSEVPADTWIQSGSTENQTVNAVSVRLKTDDT